MGKLLNQVINWTIEQKREEHLERAMRNIGISFHFFEVKGDDGKSSIKWSSLDGNELNVVLDKLDLKAVLHDMQDKSLSTLDVLNKTSLLISAGKGAFPQLGQKTPLKTI